ncbi:MAG: hypothetical protein IJO40_09320, partial [Thermoguttaceae bacterium]|nr:hypothetical protein [Thermoguttaceae bacterium]
MENDSTRRCSKRRRDDVDDVDHFWGGSHTLDEKEFWGEPTEGNGERRGKKKEKKKEQEIIY